MSTEGCPFALRYRFTDGGFSIVCHVDAPILGLRGLSEIQRVSIRLIKLWMALHVRQNIMALRNIIRVKVNMSPDR